jgi:hypothetical protein
MVIDGRSPRKSKHLSSEQLNKSLALHTAIKTFRHYFPEEFKKTNIIECTSCKGLGITNKHELHPEFICDDCMGVGFTGYEYLENEYVCKKCNGIGCQNCNYKGFVDWIRNAMKFMILKQMVETK